MFGLQILTIIPGYGYSIFLWDKMYVHKTLKI